MESTLTDVRSGDPLSIDVVGVGGESVEGFGAIGGCDVEGTAESPGMETDSIAGGLSFMMVTNVFQRGVGFFRNLAFCHFLAQHDLGLWALSSSFFLLAAPLAVLGLPGSFGRFVETYRVRQQLGSYVRRMLVGSTFGTLVLCSLLLASSLWGSEWIFGERQSLGTMAIVALTLACTVAFNFTTELLSGLRQAKAVSMMQMVNSLTFTVLGAGAVFVYRDWRLVVLAFAGSGLVALLPGMRVLWGRCRLAFDDAKPLGLRSMWQRILPFAASIWVMNLLSNLFDVVDRYMLLHLSVGAASGEPSGVLQAELGQAMVGQYHCGRILPLLVLSLAMMVNGILLPYMSAEWESMRMDRLRGLLMLASKLMLLFFWGVSIGGLIVAPWIFHYLLAGRYDVGLSIMPMAMVHCTLTAVAMLLHNYFWCAERGRAIGVMLGSGLILNIGLNYVLVPWMGAQGAMTATAVSGVWILGFAMLMLKPQGIDFPAKMVVLFALPWTMLISPWFSLVIFVATLVVGLRSNTIFSGAERALILGAWKGARIGGLKTSVD